MPFRLIGVVGAEVNEGVLRRARGGGLRARLGGRGDAGGKAGSFARVDDEPVSIFFKVSVFELDPRPHENAGDIGAGEADADVIGVEIETSVVNMLTVVERGEDGPESTSAGGIDLKNAESTARNGGDGGRGIECGDSGREILNGEAWGVTLGVISSN